MARYSNDFGRGRMGYGRDFQQGFGGYQQRYQQGSGGYQQGYSQWGSRPGGYDREFGFRGNQGSQGGHNHWYGRDFMTNQPYRSGSHQRYDRSFNQPRNPSYNQSYDQPYDFERPRGSDSWRGYSGRPIPREPGYPRQDPYFNEGYPSPWDESHPGQNYSYGLGYGMGRGQFIYK